MSTAIPGQTTAVSSAPVVSTTSAPLKGGMGHLLGPVTAMTFILGAFIGLALKTQNVVRSDNLHSSRYSGLAEAYVSMKRNALAYQATIKNLQNTNEQLDQTVSQGAPQIKVITDQINQARFIAGLTDVEGPGIVVTLSDSKHAPAPGMQPGMPSFVLNNYLIHDTDILRVLNELKDSGAEAFSVNNQRIVATSAVRCVGTVVQVNYIQMASPYRIKAIGDPHTLMTAMNMTGGVGDGFKVTDPAMFSVTKADKLLIPAYSGATQFRYAKPKIASVTGKDADSMSR